MNRKRFSEICAFWDQFKRTPIKQIWEIAAERKRGVNLFIKTNLQAFYPDGTPVDPERLHFSAGKLSLPHQLKAVRMEDDAEKVEVTWQDDLGIGLSAKNDDLMMMIAHEGKFIGPIATGFIRGKEGAIIQLPAETGAPEGIYLYFASPDRMQVYTGSVFWTMMLKVKKMQPGICLISA
jgi:hypothetical protein